MVNTDFSVNHFLFHNQKREDVLAATVPESTPTYKPLPNSLLLNTIQTEIQEKGFRITQENYNSSRKGLHLFGIWTLNGEDPELNPSIAFVNSYDKSRAFRIASGAIVKICSNGMIRGSAYNSRRKHIGEDFNNDWNNMVSYAVETLEEEYNTLSAQKEAMKAIELTNKDLGYLFGDLYFNEEIISLEQLSIIKKIRNSKPEDELPFTDNSLWAAYNNVTEAIKHGNSVMQFQSHAKLHDFVEQNFKIEPPQI